MAQKTFRESIELLNSLQSNASARKDATNATTEQRLQRFRLYSDILNELGYIPSDFNKLNIIHIAGSKGKGSTAATTASILSQLLSTDQTPRKIGVFTSPHIRTIRERIQIISGPVTTTSDWMISENQFAKYFFEVWEILHEKHRKGILKKLPTFFQTLFFVAIHAFMREGVDAAIIECGIGGERDVTNILDTPVVSAITTLELEHTDLLGGTLKEIAWHKGGIMRAGVPAFTIPQQPEALLELQNRAAEKGTKLTVVDPKDLTGTSEFYSEMEGWQVVNSAMARQLAFTFLDTLSRKGFNDYPDAEFEHHVQKGVRDANIAGRFEIRSIGLSEWYLDGAHTQGTIQKAAQWFASKCQRKPTDLRILLFNQEGRETAPMLSLLHQELCRGKDTTRLTHALFCSNAPFAVNQFNLESESMVKKAEGTEVCLDPENYQTKNAKLWEDVAQSSDQTVLTFPTIRDCAEYIRGETVAKQRTAACFVTGSLHLIGGMEVVLDLLAKDPSNCLV